MRENNITEDHLKNNVNKNQYVRTNTMSDLNTIAKSIKNTKKNKNL